MLGLQWKKTHPNVGATRQFLPVSNELDAPFVAGAFKRNEVKSAERRFKMSNDGFHPGVFDHKTNSCVINDENKAEDDYYLLTRSSSIQVDWVPEKDGNIPTGAIQCGFRNDGSSLYVGRFICEGRLLCGQVNEDQKQCEVNILGKRFTSNTYEVLCLRSVPIGFTYNSMYGLRSSLTTPVCNMISSKLSIHSEESNDSTSPVFTPPPTPTITRNVTSSQTTSVTVKKVVDLPNGSSSPHQKSPSPEPTPVQELTPPRPRKIEFPSIPDTPETPATAQINGILKSTKKLRNTPNTKWQRYGKGFRLVRSPPRFSPLT